MNGQTIIVPEYKDVQGPLVFLAGPIQGAEDWQSKAIDILRENAPDLHIASPRWNKVYKEGEFTQKMYEEQVDWETHYLQRAAGNGGIMFWLAKEKEHFCHRAYAQTSRVEYGEWINELKHKPAINIMMGIEKGYTGEKYIRYRFEERLGKICSSLEETCLRAVKEIYDHLSA
ncbi:nucleoside 2-deoxyribosyltransferase domain-containing protein [Candidatus Woesearchaeota archaeon]|nr:nucleoside 2-deoxyribosyltransferase domain-containing protein [Candidatus Woesearchaeota archaeon]